MINQVNLVTLKTLLIIVFVFRSELTHKRGPILNHYAEKKKEYVTDVTFQKFLVFSMLLWPKMVIKVFNITHAQRSPKEINGTLIV